MSMGQRMKGWASEDQLIDNPLIRPHLVHPHHTSHSKRIAESQGVDPQAISMDPETEERGSSTGCPGPPYA